MLKKDTSCLGTLCDTLHVLGAWRYAHLFSFTPETFRLYDLEITLDVSSPFEVVAKLDDDVLQPCWAKRSA